MGIRMAVAADVPRMVELSEQKRTEYERYQPVFWRKADGAGEKQVPFFVAQLTKPNAIALVQEELGKINGFVIAVLVESPPVYDPGGLTCLIDDFTVARKADWESIGPPLLEEVRRRALANGAVQMVVFCGHLDEPKRVMLSDLGFSIATEVYVRLIVD